MQEIQDLIPKLQQLKDLYHSEDFKPLEEFLRSSRDQIEVELHTIDPNKSSFIDVVALTRQSNLLGTILNLPQMVQSLSDQFKANEVKIQKEKERFFDPLDIEGA